MYNKYFEKTILFVWWASFRYALKEVEYLNVQIILSTGNKPLHIKLQVPLNKGEGS